MGEFNSPPVTLTCQRMQETHGVLQYYFACINFSRRKQVFLLRNAQHKYFLISINNWLIFINRCKTNQPK